MVMLEQHKTILKKLVKEGKFPLTEYNLSEDDVGLINEVVSIYDKKVIKKEMERYIDEVKNGKIL